MFTKIKAFTLFEILIALFIFTIVSLITASTLHIVLNNQARLKTQSHAFSELAFALLLIARDTEQAVNRPILNNHSEQEPAFLANSQQMTFTHAGLMNPFNQLLRSTLQRTRYRIEMGNLIRDTWPMLDQAQNSQPIARVLLHDV